MTPHRSRPGAALLEALASVMVLGIFAAGLLRAGVEARDAMEAGREAEERSRRAEALLDAATLWSRTELEQRLGEREQGAMLLRIVRVSPALFDLTVADSTGVELLKTTVHRPTVVADER